MSTISLYLNKFKDQLQKDSRLANNNSTATFSDASIFSKYFNQFKKFFAEETNTDISVLNSISSEEFKKAEIINNELVLPTEKNNIFEKEEDEEIEISTSDSQNDDSDIESALLEAESEEDVPPDTDTEEINADNKTLEQEQSTDSGNTEQDNGLQFILDKFFENKYVKAIADSDADGNISTEEHQAFLNLINQFDGNLDNISLEDLITTIGIIEKLTSDGKFDTSDELKTDDSTKEELSSEAQSTEKSGSSSGAGGTGSTGGTSGYSGGYQSSDTGSTEGNQEATLDNMTSDEIKQEIDNNAAPNLKAKQGAFDNIYNSNEVKALEEDVDKKLNEYKDLISKEDAELASNVEKKEQEITAKEKEIAENEAQITKQESVITVCKQEQANSQAAINNLNAQKSNLEAEKSKVESENSSVESNTTQLLNNINNKINEINKAIEAEQKRKEAADKALQQAEDELNTLNAAKEKMAGELSTLQTEKTELDTKVAELEKNNPAIQSAHEAYNEAKTKLSQGKQELHDKAKAEMVEAQEYLTKLNEVYSTKKCEEDKKTYSAEPVYNAEVGKAFAEMAAKVAKDKNSIGMCLAGVSYAARKFFGGATALSSLHYAYLSTDVLRNDPFLSQHFKEVKVSRSELSSLPPGYIVVWDRGGLNASAAGKKAGHIAVTLGNGKEASDHIQKQMVNRKYANDEDRFYVFMPV